jgi:hypothetical protein
MAGDFLPVDIDDSTAGELDADCLRAVWLHAGLEQARMGVGA